MASNQSDPDVPYRYMLEIGDISTARFNEVQGLKSISSYRSDPGRRKQLPRGLDGEPEQVRGSRHQEGVF